MPNVEIERAQKAHAHVDETSNQRRFLSSARMPGWAMVAGTSLGTDLRLQSRHDMDIKVATINTPTFAD